MSIQCGTSGFTRKSTITQTIVANIGVGCVFGVWAVYDALNTSLALTPKALLVYIRLITLVCVLLIPLLYVIPLFRRRSYVYIPTNISFTVLTLGAASIMLVLPLPHTTYLSMLLVMVHPRFIIMPRKSFSFSYTTALPIIVSPIMFVIGALFEGGYRTLNFYFMIAVAMFAIVFWTIMLIVLTIPIEKAMLTRYLSSVSYQREAAVLRDLIERIVPPSVATQLIENGKYQGSTEAAVIDAAITGWDLLPPAEAETALSQAAVFIGQLSDLGITFGARTVRNGASTLRLLGGQSVGDLGNAVEFATLGLTAFQVLRDNLTSHLHPSLRLSIGIGFGKVRSAVIGVTRPRYEIWGPAVSKAAKCIVPMADIVCTTQLVAARLPDDLLVTIKEHNGLFQMSPTPDLRNRYRNRVQLVIPCDITDMSTLTHSGSVLDDLGLCYATDTVTEGFGGSDSGLESFSVVSDDLEPRTKLSDVVMTDDLAPPPRSLLQGLLHSVVRYGLAQEDMAAFYTNELEQNWPLYQTILRVLSMFLLFAIVPFVALPLGSTSPAAHGLAVVFISVCVMCVIIHQLMAFGLQAIGRTRAVHNIKLVTCIVWLPIITQCGVAVTTVACVPYLDVSDTSFDSIDSFIHLHAVIIAMIPFYMLMSSSGCPSGGFVYVLVAVSLFVAAISVLCTLLDSGKTLSIMISSIVVGVVLTVKQRFDQARAWRVTRSAVKQGERTKFVIQNSSRGLIDWTRTPEDVTDGAPLPRPTVLTRQGCVFIAQFPRLLAYADQTSVSSSRLVNLVHQKLDGIVMGMDELEKVPAGRTEYIVISGMRQLLDLREVTDAVCRFALRVEDELDALIRAQILPPGSIQAGVAAGNVTGLLYASPHSKWLKDTVGVTGEACTVARQLAVLNSGHVLVSGGTSAFIDEAHAVPTISEHQLPDGTVCFTLEAPATSPVSSIPDLTQPSTPPDVDLGFMLDTESSTNLNPTSSAASLPSLAGSRMASLDPVLDPVQEARRNASTGRIVASDSDHSLGTDSYSLSSDDDDDVPRNIDELSTD